MAVPEVDLNADLGEEVTDDAGLLQVVTSAVCIHGDSPGARGSRLRRPVVLVLSSDHPRGPVDNLWMAGPVPVEHGTTSVGNPVGPEVCRRNPCGGVPGRHRTLLPEPLRRDRGSDRTNSSTRRACSPRRPGDGVGGSWKAGAVARTSPSRANRGAPDAHTIGSPSTHFLPSKAARRRLPSATSAR